MCSGACIQFGKSRLRAGDVINKAVLEVGARDVNGSLRAVVEELEPLTYLGVDVEDGPGVDDRCDINELVFRYGRDRFDLVICTEVLEHVRDWRGAVSNLKNVLKPNGVLLVTTRSKGFIYHGYPRDYWRYEVEDMEAIFADLLVEANEADPSDPGVFVLARKPASFSEADLAALELRSVVTNRRCRNVTEFSIYVFKAKRMARRFLGRVLPATAKTALKKRILKE